MPSLTNYGQQIGLYDDTRTILPGTLAGTAAAQGGIAHIADRIDLYSGLLGNVEDKDASLSSFSDPAGGGYLGSQTITKGGSWSLPSATSGDTQIVLTPNITFTATGNPINDVGGAVIRDEADNVIAWWERSSDITLATNDTITADQLTIRIV